MRAPLGLSHPAAVARHTRTRRRRWNHQSDAAFTRPRVESPPRSLPGRRGGPSRCSHTSLSLSHVLDNVRVTGVRDAQHSHTVQASARGAEVDVVCTGEGHGTRVTTHLFGRTGTGAPASGNSALVRDMQRTCGFDQNAASKCVPCVQTQLSAPSPRTLRRELQGWARRRTSGVRAGRAGGGAYCRCSDERRSWRASRSTRSQTCAPRGSCWR